MASGKSAVPAGYPTRFTGHFALKLAGVPIENSDLTEGAKIEVKTDTPDTAGKAGLVRDILGGVTPAHDPKPDDGLAAAHALQLGGIEAVSYLGQEGKTEGPKTVPDPNYLTLYVIEFAQGERICALHQAPDGMLDAFQCF